MLPARHDRQRAGWRAKRLFNEKRAEKGSRARWQMTRCIAQYGIVSTSVGAEALWNSARRTGTDRPADRGASRRTGAGWVCWPRWPRERQATEKGYFALVQRPHRVTIVECAAPR